MLAVAKVDSGYSSSVSLKSLQSEQTRSPLTPEVNPYARYSLPPRLSHRLPTLDSRPQSTYVSTGVQTIAETPLAAPGPDSDAPALPENPYASRWRRLRRARSSERKATKPASQAQTSKPTSPKPTFALVASTEQMKASAAEAKQTKSARGRAVKSKSFVLPQYPNPHSQLDLVDQQAALAPARIQQATAQRLTRAQPELLVQLPPPPPMPMDRNRVATKSTPNLHAYHQAAVAHRSTGVHQSTPASPPPLVRSSTNYGPKPISPEVWAAQAAFWRAQREQAQREQAQSKHVQREVQSKHVQHSQRALKPLNGPTDRRLHHMSGDASRRQKRIEHDEEPSYDAAACDQYGSPALHMDHAVKSKPRLTHRHSLGAYPSQSSYPTQSPAYSKQSPAYSKQSPSYPTPAIPHLGAYPEHKRTPGRMHNFEVIHEMPA